MSAKFALKDAERNAYVEQIVAVGLAALETRARGGSKESEASTRREAESVVQATYITCMSAEDLRAKIAKMTKKLDPYTVITTYLQNRPLVQRLVQTKNPMLHREAAILENVLSKGTEVGTLLSMFSDLKKANSVVKAYTALQKDVVRELSACAHKLDAALRMHAQPGTGAGNGTQHLSRVLVDVLPQIAERLQKLALPPAALGCIAAPLKALSTKPLDGNTHALCSSLVSCLVALTLSLANSDPAPTIGTATVTGVTSETAYMLPQSNLQPMQHTAASTQAAAVAPDFCVAAMR